MLRTTGNKNDFLALYLQLSSIRMPFAYYIAWSKMPRGSLDGMSVQGIVRFQSRGGCAQLTFGEIILRIPMIGVMLSCGAAPPSESSHGYSRGLLQ